MLNYLKFMTILAISATALGAQTIKLNESLIETLAKKGSPQLDEIEAALLSTQVREGEENESYSPELFGRGSYTETNERALIGFQPIFSPIKQAQLGVRQTFKHGVSTSASIITDQRSSSTSPLAGHFKDATTTTMSFTVQLDVWKNLFGRLSKAKLDSAQLDSKRAKLEKEIQTKTFQISLRRLYWSLVANNEALKISEALLETAQTQAKDAAQRLKNAVADADEVARYKAQVAARQGSVLFLKYQKETYLKQLRNLLPELGTNEITLGDYNIEKTMTEVLACTSTIASQTSVPYGFTKYDEVVGLLRKIRANNATVNARYSDADVSLFGTVKATGVSSEEAAPARYRGSFGGSIDDIEEQNRTGYEVGVNFSLPLGSVKENTKRVKELYDEKRLLASINGTEAQVVNTHIQLVKSINLLTEVITSQRTSSRELGKRLVGMKRKYEQARVSVNDLVMDQDAFLNSELTTIDTQLQILNTIFDYLVVYTETPCVFNRN